MKNSNFPQGVPFKINMTTDLCLGIFAEEALNAQIYRWCDENSADPAFI
jgi:hypothetical protein